ncbi:dihydroorotase, partial [Salmonella enterica subsp. enterica serovar Newport]
MMKNDILITGGHIIKYPVTSETRIIHADGMIVTP